MRSPLPDPIRSILIIKLSSLGDLLLLTPAIAAIRNRWPAASISVLSGAAAAPLLAGNPDIDRVVVHGGETSSRLFFMRGIRAFWRTLRRLRRERFDLALDFQGLTRSWLFLRLARARFRAGKGRFPLLDRSSPHRRQLVRHALLSYFELTDLIGVPRPEEALLRMRPPEPEMIQRGIIPERMVLCNPFTRGWGKAWPEPKWIGLGRALVDAGYRPVFSGAPGDRRAAERIAAAVGPGALSIAGSVSLRGLAGWISRAEMLVSVDSAPLHLAAALGRPVVGIFGPTDPARTGPWGERAVTVGRAAGCAPMRMDGISEEKVLAAVLELLSASGAS